VLLGAGARERRAADVPPNEGLLGLPAPRRFGHDLVGHKAEVYQRLVRSSECEVRRSSARCGVRGKRAPTVLGDSVGFRDDVRCYTTFEVPDDARHCRMTFASIGRRSAGRGYLSPATAAMAA
jgi:hypothetical protein